MFTPSRNQRRSTCLTPRSGSSMRNASLRKSILSRTPTGYLNNTSLLLSPSTSSFLGSSSHNFQASSPSLPVLVVEAISLADLSSISVGIGKDGWSWLVNGQQLFVWNHKQVNIFKSSVCKELRIPFSTCNSNLVSVAYDSKNESVSVIGISQNGQICFWSNILSSTNVKFQSEIETTGAVTECLTVQPVQSHGYIVATKVGVVHHILPKQNGISCHLLQNTSRGVLSGISRRVSSFFFSPSVHTANLIQVLVSANNSQEKTSDLLLLTDGHLQKWRLTPSGGGETLNMTQIAEIDLMSALAPKVADALWEATSTRVGKLTPLDVRRASRNTRDVAVLLHVTGSRDHDDHAARLVVCVFAGFSPDAIANATVVAIDHAVACEVGDEGARLRLVVEDPTRRSLAAFVVWSRDLIIFKHALDRREEVVASPTSEQIMCAEECDGRYVFLSSSSGMLTCSSNSSSMLPASVEESVLNSSGLQTPRGGGHSACPSPSAGGAFTPQAVTPTHTQIERLESSDDAAQRLQAAFLHFCRRNLDQAHTLISEAFPAAAEDSPLDGAVVMVSTNLLDDYPACDPRWAESVPHDVSNEQSGQYGSLILLHQLQDKQNAHAMFLSFLSEMGLGKRLDSYTCGRDVINTTRVLCEHAEKLCVAVSLWQKHSAHAGIIDKAIRRVLGNRDQLVSTGSLTHKDLFYREVSKIEEIFEFLVDEEEKALDNIGLSQRERVFIISGVSSVLEAVLMSAQNRRKSGNSPISMDASRRGEFVPWTVATKRTSLRKIVIEQHKLVLERGIPEAEDQQQRAAMLQQAASLADLVLHDYSLQLTSLVDHDDDHDGARRAEVGAMREKHRSQLIGPLLDLHSTELAISLAEKHQDFNTLVRACARSDDSDKLQNYMRKFAAQGFGEFVFRWYLERGNYRAVLSCCGDDPTLNKDLASFLIAHPKLAWMHQLKTGDLSATHDTLRYLAAVETDQASSKKTYLSLSKLAVAFSDEEPAAISRRIEDIDNEQLLMQYQDQLPADVMMRLGVGPESMPVYPVQKLIDLYVGDDNPNANEVDFKKAFELLSRLPPADDDPEDGQGDADAEAEALKSYIWCRAILRDTWSDVDPTHDPYETFAHTVLFKTVKLALATDSLREILPDVDRLMQRAELTELRNPTFDYMLRASFERVARTLLTS